MNSAMQRGYGPVSYTHLDVYKRQGLNYAKHIIHKEVLDILGTQ